MPFTITGPFGYLTVAHYVVGALLGAVFAVYIQARFFSPIRDVPGPFLAYFGTSWQLWHVLKGDYAIAAEQVHKKYGTFARISHNEVSVNHPDAVQAILGAPLEKGSFYRVFDIPNSNYVNIMSEVNHKRHAQKRANINSGYLMSSVIQNEPHIDSAIELLEEQLDGLTRTSHDLPLHTWLAFFGYDVLGEALFSKRFGFLEEGRDIRNAIANTFGLALYITVMAYAQWLHALLLGSPILRWLDFQPSAHTFDTCVVNINARKKNPEVRSDMIAHWLHTWKKYPDRMEEKEVFCAVLGTLAAGGETVSATMQCFFYLMLRHPAHYARLRQELDAAHARGELSAVVSYAEAQRLPFLQACIKETLRFFPVTPWNFPRVVPEGGLAVAGHAFKAGSLVSTNCYVLHRNKDVFGSDAEVFNPLRWLDPASKSLDQYMITFGNGPRKCPGQNLARLEINKVTATLIRDFDIRLANPEKEWKYHTLFVVVAHGWSVYMKRRRGPTMASVAVSSKRS